MTNMDFKRSYTTQTGRSLYIRFKEHSRSIAFGIHILNNTHQYGRMEDTMDETGHTNNGQIGTIKTFAYSYTNKKFWEE
jgi:hypothetical protein